jgi:succinylglutamate desuccinylase
MINIAQEAKTRKTSEIKRMLTETDMTMLFFRSRRSDTIRCRASAAPQQQLKDQFAINNTRKSFFLQLHCTMLKLVLPHIIVEPNNLMSFEPQTTG